MSCDSEMCEMVFRHRYTDKQKQCSASRRGPAKDDIETGPRAMGQTDETGLVVAVILISIFLARVAWMFKGR